MTAPVLEPTSENLRRAAERIRAGGVVVAPSDTNLALTLDPHDPEAIERAYAIKDRPTHKPLTLFVRDPTAWRRYGTHPEPAAIDALAEAFWPGPLNVVVNATDQVPHDRLTREGTVSIGCLSNPVWRELVEYVDSPVAMTSANVSGTRADDELVAVEVAREHVGDGVELILADEPEGTTRASTIVDTTGEAQILRRGDLSAGEIASVLDDTGLSHTLDGA